MNEEKIKQSFAKAKQDIQALTAHIIYLKKEIEELKRTIQSTHQQTDRQTDTSTDNQTQNSQKSTLRQINKTIIQPSTHSSTDNMPLEAVKSQNTNISTGNRGVSTDKQTDRQTDTSTGNGGVRVRLNLEETDKIDNLQKISELINSLDDLKKELRHKLKKLTNQEMTVLSTIYQLEEEGFTVDYSLIAQKISLTESSIRDYVQRIIKKGIPIQKYKENNKKVNLSISRELRKIASLSTIIELRDL